MFERLYYSSSHSVPGSVDRENGYYNKVNHIHIILVQFSLSGQITCSFWQSYQNIVIYLCSQSSHTCIPKNMYVCSENLSESLKRGFRKCFGDPFLCTSIKNS